MQHWRQARLRVHLSAPVAALRPALVLLQLLLLCRRPVRILLPLLLAPRLSMPPLLRFHLARRALLPLLPAPRPPSLPDLGPRQRLMKQQRQQRLQQTRTLLR